MLTLKSIAARDLESVQIARCPHCNSEDVYRRAGRHENEGPMDHCANCGYAFPHKPGTVTARQHIDRVAAMLDGDGHGMELLSRTAIMLAREDEAGHLHPLADYRDNGRKPPPEMYEGMSRSGFTVRVKAHGNGKYTVTHQSDESGVQLPLATNVGSAEASNASWRAAGNLHDHPDLIRQHRMVVENALKAGKDVPAEVLKDYPDIARKYGKGPQAKAEESPAPAPQSQAAKNLDVDTSRQFGLFAKDSKGNAVEVGEHAGQANLFNPSKYKAVEKPVEAAVKPQFDPKHTAEMFPASKAGQEAAIAGHEASAVHAEKEAARQYETSEYPNAGRGAYRRVAEAHRDMAQTLRETSNAATAVNPREQRQIDRASRLRIAAAKAKIEAAEQFAKSHNATSGIPFGQPILVGHHSESRHRNAIARSDAAMGRGVAATRKAEELERRADAAESNDAIYRDDPEAVHKLKEQLAAREQRHERMKQINALYKKHGSVDAIPGLSDAERDRTRLNMRFNTSGVPYPAYALQNNNANIRRIKQRIEQVGRLQAMPARSRKIGDIRVLDNQERQSVEVHFPGKPSSDVIQHMKERGFRWTPSIKAWTRGKGDVTEMHLKSLSEKLGKPLEHTKEEKQELSRDLLSRAGRAA